MTLVGGGRAVRPRQHEVFGERAIVLPLTESQRGGRWRSGRRGGGVRRQNRAGGSL